MIVEGGRRALKTWFDDNRRKKGGSIIFALVCAGPRVLELHDGDLLGATLCMAEDQRPQREMAMARGSKTDDEDEEPRVATATTSREPRGQEARKESPMRNSKRSPRRQTEGEDARGVPTTLEAPTTGFDPSAYAGWSEQEVLEALIG